MSYARFERALPPVRWFVAGLFFAGVLPFLLLIWILSLGAAYSEGGASELAVITLFFVGQSFLLAIPLGVRRWRVMERPLLECLVIGAITAPGPLGYAGVGLLAVFSPMAIVVFAVLAIAGAMGGFIFWAIVTRFGREFEPLK